MMGKDFIDRNTPGYYTLVITSVDMETCLLKRNAVPALR